MTLRVDCHQTVSALFEFFYYCQNKYTLPFSVSFYLLCLAIPILQLPMSAVSWKSVTLEPGVIAWKFCGQQIYLPLKMGQWSKSGNVCPSFLAHPWLRVASTPPALLGWNTSLLYSPPNSAILPTHSPGNGIKKYDEDLNTTLIFVHYMVSTFATCLTHLQRPIYLLQSAWLLLLISNWNFSLTQTANPWSPSVPSSSPSITLQFWAKLQLFQMSRKTHLARLSQSQA